MSQQPLKFQTEETLTRELLNALLAAASGDMSRLSAHFKITPQNLASLFQRGYLKDQKTKIARGLQLENELILDFYLEGHFPLFYLIKNCSLFSAFPLLDKNAIAEHVRDWSLRDRLDLLSLLLADTPLQIQTLNPYAEYGAICLDSIFGEHAVVAAVRLQNLVEYSGFLTGTGGEGMIARGCNPVIFEELVVLPPEEIVQLTWDFPTFWSLANLLFKVESWDKNAYPTVDQGLVYGSDIDAIFVDLLPERLNPLQRKIAACTRALTQEQMIARLEHTQISLAQWRQLRIDPETDIGILSLDEIRFVCDDLNQRCFAREDWAESQPSLTLS